MVFNGENAKHNYSLISCHILYTANKGNKKTNNRLNNKSFFFIVYFVFIIYSFSRRGGLRTRAKCILKILVQN